MYFKNKIGPNTDPCTTTPLKTDFQFSLSSINKHFPVQLISYAMGL